MTPVLAAADALPYSPTATRERQWLARVQAPLNLALPRLGGPGDTGSGDDGNHGDASYRKHADGTKELQASPVVERQARQAAESSVRQLQSALDVERSEIHSQASAAVPPGYHMQDTGCSSAAFASRQSALHRSKVHSRTPLARLPLTRYTAGTDDAESVPENRQSEAWQSTPIALTMEDAREVVHRMANTTASLQPDVPQPEPLSSPLRAAPVSLENDRSTWKAERTWTSMERRPDAFSLTRGHL